MCDAIIEKILKTGLDVLCYVVYMTQKQRTLVKTLVFTFICQQNAVVHQIAIFKENFLALLLCLPFKDYFDIILCYACGVESTIGLSITILVQDVLKLADWPIYEQDLRIPQTQQYNKIKYFSKHAAKRHHCFWWVPLKINF